MEKLRHSKIQSTGLTISHQEVPLTWSNSVSTLTGEDPSLRPVRIHTTTHSLDGSSTCSKKAGTSSTERSTPSSPSLTTSHALITIAQKVRVLVPRSTRVSKSSCWACQTVWQPSEESRFSWLQRPFVQRLCMVKPTASFCRQVNTVLTRWRLENIS